MPQRMALLRLRLVSFPVSWGRSVVGSEVPVLISSFCPDGIWPPEQETPPVLGNTTSLGDISINVVTTYYYLLQGRIDCVTKDSMNSMDSMKLFQNQKSGGSFLPVTP